MVSTSASLALLESGFESRLGLGFSGFSMWHFLKLVVGGRGGGGGGSPGTPVSSPPSSVSGFSQ